MAERTYTDAKTNAIDNIKYMAQSIYGLLPKSCKFVTKTIEVTYPSGGESELQTLDNPIYVINVQVGKSIEHIENDVYISVSANNQNDDTFLNVGTDGDVTTGCIWKYVKLSGNSASGDMIKLTLTGYELVYDF
jgi:hypothetical protein